MRMQQMMGRCIATLIVGTLMTAVPAGAQVAVDAPSETVMKVRRALERLPYYGVFDFLAFNVKDRVVTLQGFAHRPALKREAGDMVRKATGLEIANQIEVLPTSQFDDALRWDAYQRIYDDDLASRYVSGGSMTIRYEALNLLRFPDMEPYGTYPVHIVVKNRKLLLVGVVDNEFDKKSLLIRAGSVPHHLGIEDAVMVRGAGTK